MRVPISWLTTYIELRVPVDTLAERLTLAGLQVEAIDHAGSETVLTLAVTPNRPDWLSLVGVAREAAAGGCGRFKQPSFTAPKGGEATGQWLTVHVKDLVRCPRYAARVIDGVRIGPAPAEAQGRLLAAGIRPINNVVDATNYVMLELGQPLHAFDWRFLRGRQLIVRRSEAGLSFITLDGVERRLSPDDLLICDATGPVALAGIMGGANSEIRGETTRVVLESAYFAPQGIRRTSRRLGLSSESSRRFERGVDPARIDMALHRVTALIVAWAGGTPS
ncbi:MAG: phenylalanine--tRNA ligase subunit beta, partial [Deltaproteobacteria bacterium]|nr:phenylalanine--tRNA ligase subunit beta [Deltaproteobacteria bacterium]